MVARQLRRRALIRSPRLANEMLGVYGVEWQPIEAVPREAVEQGSAEQTLASDRGFKRGCYRVDPAPMTPVAEIGRIGKQILAPEHPLIMD